MERFHLQESNKYKRCRMGTYSLVINFLIWTEIRTTNEIKPLHDYHKNYANPSKRYKSATKIIDAAD